MRHGDQWLVAGNHLIMRDARNYVVSLYRKKQLNMNKKLTAFFALIIILAFIGYMIYDASTGSGKNEESGISPDTKYDESWAIDRTYSVTGGELSSVAVSPSGIIYLGGNSYVKAVDNDLNSLMGY